MGTNETIARWARYEHLDKPEPITLCWAPGHYAAEPTDHHWKAPDGIYWIDAPQFDTDITLWHGGDGLLQKIGESHAA